MDETFDLANYLPDFSEVDESTYQAMRKKAADWLRAGAPDLDTRPDSVFGDLFLNPAARMMAANEIAIARLRSDMDTESIANESTEIYDCAWVERFLAGFGVYPREGIKASGVVRFVFCCDKTFELDRGLRIQFGNDDATIFEMRLPEEGSANILPVGSTARENSNDFILHQLDTDLFATDIPVLGAMPGITVLDGEEATMDRVVADLGSLTAVGDFNPGYEDLTLPELAKKTQQTIHSASLAHRGAARNFILQEFPAARAASPLVAGDYEMVRDTLNPLGFNTGAMDLCMKSQQYAYTDSQIVRLDYYLEQDAVAVDRFIGKLDLINPAIVIESITAVEDPDVVLSDGTESSLILFSKSTDQVKYPMLSAAYSEREEIWAAVAMPRDPGNDDRLLTPLADAGGEYALFEVTYRIDPLLLPVSQFLNSSDNRPLSLQNHVRGFVPIVIDSLEIHYTKKAGVNVTLDTARDEIYDYFYSLGHPERFSDGPVADAMYYAGASSSRIELHGVVEFSAAGRVLKDGAADPTDDLADALTNSVIVPKLTITGPGSLRPIWKDPTLGTEDQTLAVIGNRNVSYFLEKEAIVFVQENESR